jgi:hypothetical protein
MDEKAGEHQALSWAGPALFAVVLIAVISFFWWLI